MLFMTELMSNVALIAVLAPVVAGIAIGLDLSILYLLIPVTIASSCAFMLPMATPPNAIVFARDSPTPGHNLACGSSSESLKQFCLWEVESSGGDPVFEVPRRRISSNKFQGGWKDTRFTVRYTPEFGV